MKVVTVPAQETFLSDLLTKIHEEGLILQTTDGQQFVVLSLAGWQGFYVGENDEFAEEVETTAENQEFMAFLAERRRNSKRIPMADVKKKLGLN